MFDKEIEAIAKCTELVKDLDEDAKFRVIKYLIERFGIASQPQNYTGNRSAPTNGDITLIQNGANAAYSNENASDPSEYPSLRDLMIKNYPKNENEWILCYSFYSSKFGTDTFTRDEILEKYRENNRLNKSTSGNLNNNIAACIKKDWIKTSGENFILKPEGINYAREILAGRSTSKEVKQTKRKSKQTQNENNA
ncbi:hypothetical protein [Pararcticibacter amylolyticus]|uniref:Uncharacterized protein n=1 Tax=Pararcticibacter amylolyticus TaxID=2173175 RepID=A0A2U2PHE1_9SPHI|nr:hypothetical protein [Pararcticibacter amylolyticus]PWG80664.1 hypothetical protein DDR33_11635 [Pararcticibacter amylolyticus]